MEYVSGEILTESGFKEGYISFEKRKIIDVWKGIPPKKPICKGYIVPSFVNSHTHIGDSFIAEKKLHLPKNVEELVAPPDGLKHKLLKEATNENIIDGMEKSLNIMINNGTSHFCDFRESGILGVCQLKSALDLWKISSTILSRSESLKYNKDEIDILLKNSDGIALSSISDWDYSELKKIARDTRQKNKIFALHASETIKENIDDILDLKPKFLVHMLKANESDFIRVKENDIPIVVCPRANSFYGLKPNFKLLKKTGVTLLLGTDNAMINSPVILDEVAYVRTISKEYSTFELLNMITFSPRKVLNLDCHILGSNSKADFVVLDKKTLKPLYVSV